MIMDLPYFPLTVQPKCLQNDGVLLYFFFCFSFLFFLISSVSVLGELSQFLINCSQFLKLNLSCFIGAWQKFEWRSIGLIIRHRCQSLHDDSNQILHHFMVETLRNFHEDGWVLIQRLTAHPSMSSRSKCISISSES